MKKMIVSALFLLVSSFAAGAGRHAARNSLEQKNFTLAIPGKTWTVEVSLPSEFAIEGPEVSPDGERAKLAAYNEFTGLRLSIFLEKAAREGDAKVARDFYWKRMQASPLKMEDVQLSEREDAAVLEYTVKEVSGKKINWKSVNLYLSHDGYWVDVHLSKIFFQSTDKEYFEQVLNSVKIIPYKLNS